MFAWIEDWIVGDYSDWHDLLREQFIKAANRFMRIIDRNAVSYSDELLIGKCPVFDEKFYYFTDRFFDEICSKIPGVRSVELKKSLSDAGILVGQGGKRNYYTVKVPIKSRSGMPKEPIRRLRIVRDWLDLPGQPTWREQIEAAGRKRNYV